MNSVSKSLTAIGLGAGLSLSEMAETVKTETFIEAPPVLVWDAIRDVYSPHTRLAPGFVVNTEADGDTRVVTFANGYTVRERIIAIDDEERLMVYSASGGRSTQHMASMQVIEAEGGSLVVWITEFSPADVKDYIAGNMALGSRLMKETLEADAGEKTG